MFLPFVPLIYFEKWQTVVANSFFGGKSSGIKRISQKITPLYVTWTPRTQTKSITLAGLTAVAARSRFRPALFAFCIKTGFVLRVHFLLRPQVLPVVLSTKHLFFMHPLRAVFHNQISTAHSVLFHFLMTVQPLSLNALTRMLLVTPRLLFRQTFSYNSNFTNEN